jgi:hypothetical protein
MSIIGKIFDKKHERHYVSLGFGTIGDWKGIYFSNIQSIVTSAPEIWGLLQRNFHRLESFSKELLNFESYLEYRYDGLCPLCGKMDKGPLGVINTNLINENFVSKTGEIEIEGSNFYCDPEEKHHNHLNIKNSSKEQDNPPLWLFLVNIEEKSLEVFNCIPTAEEPEYSSLGFFYLVDEREPSWSYIAQKSHAFALRNLRGDIVKNGF